MVPSSDVSQLGGLMETPPCFVTVTGRGASVGVESTSMPRLLPGGVYTGLFCPSAVASLQMHLRRHLHKGKMGSLPPVTPRALGALLSSGLLKSSCSGCCSMASVLAQGFLDNWGPKKDLAYFLHVVSRVKTALKPLLPPLFTAWGLLEPVLGEGVQITAMGIFFPCQKLGWGRGVWVSSGTAFPARLGVWEQHPTVPPALCFQCMGLFTSKSTEDKAVCN